MIPTRLLFPGDHLRVSRGVYDHHGIYLGDGWVIHFTGIRTSKVAATIRMDTLVDFSSSATVEVVPYAYASPAAEVVARATSRLGHDGYHLFANNCEHFARWCKTGEHMSEQSRAAFAHATGVGGGASATAAALGVVSSAGVVAGVSGPGIVSGLASAGSVVGAGAAGGIPVLGAVPGAIATAAMHHAFKDDPRLPQTERAARKGARIGSTVGAAGGAVGALAAISAAGIPGLSAAGITSGLATIGGVVGGGMLAGVAVTVAAPAVLAVAIGHIAYRWRAKH